ncbi:MAG: hypothetical protein AAF331_09325 [Pseudomonadota bacterium]
MTQSLSLRDLVADTLNKTARVIVPSLPYGALFVVACAVLVFCAGTLPEGGAGFVVFAVLFFAALYAHSLFSAAMYRAALASQGGLMSSAWKLTLAWLLVLVVASIAATIVLLFFSLIGASLGVASGAAGQEITDMTAEMRAGGTFWPLFVVFIATMLGLFWFAVRLMLFAGATVVRHQVHVFRTWYWTKGRVIILAPLMIIFIVLPISVLAVIAQTGTTAIFGVLETPLEMGISVAFVTLIMLPSAWLGHGFAASAYERLAPHEAVDEI